MSIIDIFTIGQIESNLISRLDLFGCSHLKESLEKLLFVYWILINLFLLGVFSVNPPGSTLTQFVDRDREYDCVSARIE